MTSMASVAELAMATHSFLSRPFLDGVFRGGYGWAATRIACRMLGCPEETLLHTPTFCLSFRQRGDMPFGSIIISALCHFSAHPEVSRQGRHFISTQPYSALDRVTSYDLPDVPEPYRHVGPAPLDGPALQHRAWTILGTILVR